MSAFYYITQQFLYSNKALHTHNEYVGLKYFYADNIVNHTAFMIFGQPV